MATAVRQARQVAVCGVGVEPRLLAAGAVLAFLALGGLYWSARLPVVTLLDASVYVASALALAQGHGHALSGYLATPANTYYPPGYSLLLAPILALQPSVPAALPALQLLNLATFYALLGLGALVLRRCFGASRGETLLATALVATTPLAAELSTRLLSDSLYGALGLAALLALHAASLRGDGRAAGWLLLGGVLAVAAFYTRTAGIALLAALAIESLRQARQQPWWRTALGLAPGLLVLPWLAFTARHGGSLYWREYTQGQPGWGVAVDSAETLLAVVLGNLLLGADTLFAVAPLLVSGEVLPWAALLTPLAWLAGASLYLYALWQSARRWWRGDGVAHLYVLLALLLVLPLPYRVVGRYVWPVAPILAWYLLVGLRELGDWLTARTSVPRGATASVVLGAILAANLVFLAGLATRVAVGPPRLDAEYLTLLDMAEYLRASLPADAVLGTNHNAGALWWHQYTGRSGLDSIARADDLEPNYTRLAAQGDPAAITHFVYHRANGTPGRGVEDWPVVRAALSARGASTTPRYCAGDEAVCVFDWRAEGAP